MTFAWEGTFLKWVLCLWTGASTWNGEQEQWNVSTSYWASSCTSHQSVHTYSPSGTDKLTFLGTNTQALWLSDKSLCYTSLEITFLEIPELTTAYNLYRCWYWVYAPGACFWIPPWSWGHDQSPSSLLLRSGLLLEAVNKVSLKTQYWYVSYD